MSNTTNIDSLIGQSIASAAAQQAIDDGDFGDQFPLINSEGIIAEIGTPHGIAQRGGRNVVLVDWCDGRAVARESASDAMMYDDETDMSSLPAYDAD
jgi:hypothetical protein